MPIVAGTTTDAERSSSDGADDGKVHGGAVMKSIDQGGREVTAPTVECRSWTPRESDELEPRSAQQAGALRRRWLWTCLGRR